MPTLNDKSQATLVSMEHQILEHVKQALRVTLGWKVPREGLARKLSSVQFTLKSFQRHLERLMDMEEQDGYLDFVEEFKPSMHARVDRLANDHQQFRARVHYLIPRVEAVRGDDSQALESLCGEIHSLLDEIDHHDREEIELLQESLLRDVGGEG